MEDNPCSFVAFGLTPTSVAILQTDTFTLSGQYARDVGGACTEMDAKYQFLRLSNAPSGILGLSYGFDTPTPDGYLPSPEATLVTGLVPGTAVITGTAYPVGLYTTHVTVLPALARIEISPADKTLDLGQSVTLGATLFDASGHTIPEPTSGLVWQIYDWSPDATPPIGLSSGSPLSAVVTAQRYGVATVLLGFHCRSDECSIAAYANVRIVPSGITLTISPQSKTLQRFETVALTATVTNSSGAPVTNVPITWTTADPFVARIVGAATGPTVTIAADNPGGPVEVKATAGGISKSSLITVVSPPAPAAARLAFALADQPHTAAYAPTGSRSFSSANGGIRIARTNVGAYTVVFDGEQRTGAGTETVLVSAVGVEPDAEFNMCRTSGWNSNPSALTVNVNCTDSDGDPDDQGFAILLVGDRALTGRFAFALADQPTTNSYDAAAATQFTSSGQSIKITHRSGLGAYTVAFPGLDRTTSADREAVLVTPYGLTSERCGTDILAGNSVNVQCVMFNGLGIDSRFDVALISPDATHVLGIARVTNTTSIAAASSFNKSGAAVSVGRPAGQTVGRTDVTFPGLAAAVGSAPMHVQVVGSDGSGECKLTTSAWQVIAADVVVHVQCYDQTEHPADIAYTLLVIR